MTFREEYELAEKNNAWRTIKHLKNLTRWKTRVFVKRRIDEELKCQLCNSNENIVCHHIDYCEPYKVNILCDKCHLKVHNDKLQIKSIDLTKLKLKEYSRPQRKNGSYCEERKWLKEYLNVDTVGEAFNKYYHEEKINISYETWRLIMTTCYKPGDKCLKLLEEKLKIPREKFDLGYKEWKLDKLYQELDKLLLED